MFYVFLMFLDFRDLTDVYNGYRNSIFTQSDFNVCNLTSAHMPYSKNNKPLICFKYQSIYSKSNILESTDISKSISNLIKERKPLFSYQNGISSAVHKLPKDIYHECIMNASKKLRITPIQARKMYECLKLENIDVNDEQQFKLYRLDVKRRILKDLQDSENVQMFDEYAMRTQLNDEYLELEKRYIAITAKRDELLDELPVWEKNHFYPPNIQQKLDAQLNLKKKIKRKKRASLNKNL